ncbi:MAG TPA: MarR family transcriptional regulator [Acidimicrobiales bacterium]|nr:MarR family transcriptional regulator [Acidimicrobiales bacterium]
MTELTFGRSVDGGDGSLDSETALAARLRLAVTRLSRRLRQQVAGGVTPSQVSALATVERLGSPTLGELAGSEQVRPPSMTRIVVGLEAAGLVTRHVDADDRRVARVMLTAEGRRVLQRSRSLRTAFVARRLRRLSEPEREALGELVRLLERLVEEA